MRHKPDPHPESQPIMEGISPRKVYPLAALVLLGRSQEKRIASPSEERFWERNTIVQVQTIRHVVNHWRRGSGAVCGAWEGFGGGIALGKERAKRCKSRLPPRL